MKQPQYAHPAITKAVGFTHGLLSYWTKCEICDIIKEKSENFLIMTQNIVWKSLRYVLIEILLDFVYFPLWWYTRGLKKVALFCLEQIKNWGGRLSLRILFANLLKPMYSDYSKSGRIISLFLRIIVFGFKLILMVVWIIILLIIFFVYLLFPPFIIYQIILTFSGNKGFF